MEEIGTRQEILADTRIKESRILNFLEQQGLDVLVLARQDNFAWATAGGDSRVLTNVEMGAGYLVFTKTHKWLVAHSMDGRRLIDEQVPEQGFDLVTLYWHEGSPEDKVRELTAGMKVGADFNLPGAQTFGADIVDLHYPLTDLDLRRTRWVAQTSHAILRQVAHEIEPGVSEQEIAARFLLEYGRQGITTDVLIVGFDERISRYRHPMPTSNVLKKYALLHPATRRWGVHANVTRLVHFGEPPQEIRKAMDAVARLGGSVAMMLKPGARFADILEEEKRLYIQLGYPEEWHNHFQGGITGYTLADPARCLNPEARVVERQAYDYFLTITGAKFEELTLLTEKGVEIASLGEGWPTRVIQSANGSINVPDVLIR